LLQFHSKITLSFLAITIISLIPLVSADTENEGTFVLQPPLETSSSNMNIVPPWIKTSMGYWVEGKTTDAEFLNAVEFLASEKIIRVAESSSKSIDTEILSLNAQESSTTAKSGNGTFNIDSFFDVWTEFHSSYDSFFDVFFNVETPRINECLRGQELVFDKKTSSWQCSSANTVDSFFDVFFDVSEETAQNSKNIDDLERKIILLEQKIAALEDGSASGNVETEFKVEKGQ